MQTDHNCYAHTMHSLPPELLAPFITTHTIVHVKHVEGRTHNYCSHEFAGVYVNEHYSIVYMANALQLKRLLALSKHTTTSR